MVRKTLDERRSEELQTAGKKGYVHKRWLSFTLKQKFGVFAGAVVLTIGLAIFMNIVVVNFALYGFGRILDDNARSHAFQEAMEREADAFETFARRRSMENQREYEAACAATMRSLNALPFQYEEIGPRRYARTWSIRNAYESYGQARDRVAGMGGFEADYVTSLYEVYRIQDYLSSYARILVQLTLEEGNQEYLARVPMLNRIPYWLLGVGLFFIIIILYMTGVMKTAVVNPVERLAHVSRMIAHNDYTGDDIVVENRDEMGELVQAFNKMKHATAGYITTLEEKHEMAELLHREELDRVEMEKILEATRFDVLKSQINPHFLFNTLNMIACMAKLEDADTTEKMISSMSSLFRYNLKTTETEVPLKQELKVVDDYMYIQQMRFGSRIQYEKRIDVDENSVIIPSFSLQPIVENAIIHGISKKEQGGKIHVRIIDSHGQISITIADSGVGMSRERLNELRAACRERKTSKIGIGLGNIYKRLHMMYEGADLRLYSKEGTGTIIQMKIPQR